jgi:hypothetical protein
MTFEKSVCVQHRHNFIFLYNFDPSLAACVAVDPVVIELLSSPGSAFCGVKVVSGFQCTHFCLSCLFWHLDFFRNS